MANIKDLKKKIKSTKSTLKITTAMKLVSAAKLNKAQHAILSSRPYARELESTIKIISALATDYDHSFLRENPENKRTALVVISADKGLCGSYNSQIFKTARNYLAQTDEDVKVYFIGKKAREVLQKEVNYAKQFTFAKADPTFLEMQDLGRELSTLFEAGEFGRVVVLYNHFNSAISFTPTVRQLLPMSLQKEEKEELKDQYPFDFKYEPSAKEILDTLIPETYISSLYTSLLDATASEHGSRMSAMDSASSNCKEAIRTLTLKMNKLRQAAITTELTEVVSGAESLNG